MMIFHWIKWDFKMFRAQWAIFILVFGGMLATVGIRDGVQFLGMLTFIFAILPASKLMGVKFRSQHVMSRGYLLSLPRPRWEIYLMLLLRLQVFAIPFMALVVSLPHLNLSLSLNSELKFLDAGMLWCLVPVVSIWLSALQVSTQLSVETISSYLTLGQRFLAWTLHVLVSSAEFFVVVGGFGFAVLYFNIFLFKSILAAGLVVVITSIRVLLSFRRWIRA